MARNEWVRLAGALLVGAALAFPAGIAIERLFSDEPKPATAHPRTTAPATRDMFSPSLRSDPWFLERQREGVEALERHCASTGESCPEARGARQRLTELEAAAD